MTSYSFRKFKIGMQYRKLMFISNVYIKNQEMVGIKLLMC